MERYKDAVFGIALSRVRDFHAAEDIAQGVFLAAYQRLDSLKDPSRLGAWLRSMRIHQSVDFVRRPRVDPHPASVDQAASEDRGPRARLERKELRERVLGAIGRLGQAQRETTTLFYINGYSVAEVAAIQEVPLGTVKGRLHDARQKLKQQLIGMVENVLKSEAPREDFAARVFNLLNRYQPDEATAAIGWDEMVSELRKIGSDGIEGFIKALKSPHSPTRTLAAHMLSGRWTRRREEAIVELLKAALNDKNKKVRSAAAAALLSMDVDDDRKRREFLPLVAGLLADRSKRLRRCLPWILLRWAADVPLEAVGRAVVDERDPRCKVCLEHLLRAVLDAKDRPQT